ncbi:reguatory protein [Yersinia frederiksenii]|nr:reguatory protein [Yersinia frederiksenii]
MNEIIIGDIIFIPKKRIINKKGNIIKIRNKESEVLSLLCEQYPGSLSRESLEQEIWKGTYVTDNTLTQTISNLRNALDDKDHELVMTIPKKGYCLGIKPTVVSNDLLCSILPPNEYSINNVKNNLSFSMFVSVGLIYKVIALMFFCALFLISLKITENYYQVKIIDVPSLPILINLDEAHDGEFLSVYNKVPYVYLKKQKNGDYTVCKYKNGGLTCEKK